MSREIVLVNRAPVLTLWASVVAERLGYDREAALSLGKALAGLNAQSKGRRLGIYKPPEKAEGVPPKKARRGESFWVELLGRPIPATQTDSGVRAVEGDRPIEPAGVEDIFRASLERRSRAFAGPWRTWPASILPKSWRPGHFLFMSIFVPGSRIGVRGWGAKGELDLDRLRELSAKA